jgi:hypothetical protein
MSDKNYGPAYLANSATNVIQGGGGVAGLYDNLQGIEITNTDTAQQTFSLWKGLTGASTGGTELFKDYPVGAKQTLMFPYPGKGIRFDTTDFLVGLASAASKVTITLIYQRNAT